MRILGVFLICLTILTLASAGGSAKKEEVPKYMAMLKSAEAKDRALAADMLGKRGAIKRSDVLDAVEPLKTMLQKDSAGAARAAAAPSSWQYLPGPDGDRAVVARSLAK